MVSGEWQVARGVRTGPLATRVFPGAGCAMTEDLRRRVLELYREVDQAVAAAGPVCVASGRCCRFKEFGHVLYLSGLEAEILLDAAPPYDRPVSADFCPFQKEKLCT